MDPVDVVLLGAALLAAVIGWRIGLLQGLLGFVGFIAGLSVMVWFIPTLAPDWQIGGVTRTVLVAALVLCGALLGQAIGSLIGGWLRLRLDAVGGQRIDSLLGSALAVAAAAVAVWSIATVITALTSPTGVFAQSRVVAAVDQVMPTPARQALNGLASIVHDATLPLVVGGLFPGTAGGEPPPMSDLTPAADAALDSVVRVSGSRPECGNGATGSGYVSTPQHVTTNAHVVAAMEQPRVTTRTGKSYRATVVGFDPQLDVAVLHVPDLDLPALPSDTSASVGTAGIVAGYPGGGGLQVSPAMVRAVLGAGRLGTDIYGNSGVSREAIVINAEVRPGNSGGPLLSQNGTVLGLVFAQAVEDPQVGYALTAAQFRELPRQVGASTTAVSTGFCPAP